ncbi:uncharacterized protein LOC111916947 [Lactuca sativa]|uniref:uncharacterized protein LOC111916947 n=1 Tax=Lactuca sativa TaxID=4236 RepID=UPI000CD99E70|nr:uncharacterized protein LOC111916947 [Lactuca sativa]
MSSSSSPADDVLDNVVQSVVSIHNMLQQRLNNIGSSNDQRKRRRYIQRQREAAHQRPMQDYFDENALFEGYFSVDGFGCIKICLCHIAPPDALDESFSMSARTARDSLHEFCIDVMSLYGPRYLRRPTTCDIQQLYAHHGNVHGLPRMLGSLDCMNWRWNVCPKAYQGQYTKGNYHYPTVVLEAVASQDLWIWHAFFDSSGLLNDVDILNNSPIFNKVYDGTAPDSSFVLRGTEYKFWYYLVDGIYPDLSIFVKSLSCPDDPQRAKFKRVPKKARKDIEQAFGALKKRWKIVAKPSIFRDISNMT